MFVGIVESSSQCIFAPHVSQWCFMVDKNHKSVIFFQKSKTTSHHPIYGMVLAIKEPPHTTIEVNIDMAIP